jgi:ABC-2 type transport system ATP-binding protein
MTHVLAVHDVRHAYGDNLALAGVTLSVDAGEFVALLGPNGAGKTTLVRSIIGLIQPATGSIEVAGGSPSQAAVRRRLGVVQQDVGFPSTLTVREIVEGAAARAGADRGRAEEAMAEMGLLDLAERRASNLSGGQQQRLQLAMGLVADPLLLVLDEPTAGLDAASRKAFWATLDERRQRGTGVLLTTHIVEEAAALADRIVVLHRGQVVAEGTPAELKRTLPGRRVTARTSLPAEVLRAVDGVVSVTTHDGEVDITATEAEPVVRTMLDLDPATSDLVVATASLDDVLIALTDGEKELVA